MPTAQVLKVWQMSNPLKTSHSHDIRTSVNLFVTRSLSLSLCLTTRLLMIASILLLDRIIRSSPIEIMSTTVRGVP